MSESFFLQAGVILAVILISMTLHEVMHGVMAYWLGDDTAKAEGRLSLNPLKHIDPFLTILLPLILALAQMPIFGGAKPVPFNPHRVRYGEWGAALVAIAGPLTNLFLAFMFFGVGAIFGIGLNLWEGNNIGQTFLTYGVIINLGFFAFNMIPIPPLDGSRVLYALAPESVKRAMEYIEQYAFILLFAIVLLAYSAFGMYIRTVTQFFIELFSNIFRLY